MGRSGWIDVVIYTGVKFKGTIVDSKSVEDLAAPMFLLKRPRSCVPRPAMLQLPLSATRTRDSR